VLHGPDAVDLLEGGTGPPWWRQAWGRLTPWGRRSLVVLVVAALAVAGAVLLHDRAVERELERRVSLAATLGIWSSSTVVPGGAVDFYVVVRNEGPRPLTVIAVDGTGPGLRVAMRDAVDRPVAAGGEVEIPLSVRLTCGAAEADLSTEIGVLRSDGTSAVRGIDLQSATRLLDVAATLCAVRPELRDHELSGPILRRAEAAKNTGG
jgi:hypothetical protein